MTHLHPRTVLIVAGFIFFLAGLLLVSFDASVDAPLVSAIFIIVLALPSYAALLRWLGLSRGLAVLLAITILPVLVEALAIVTGFPYGSFAYSEGLGYLLFGLVPWTVAFAYPPILLGALTLGAGIAGTDRWRFILAGAVLVVVFDLVIDPAAVHAGFWYWETPGLYFGIPPVNFAGWLLTGAVYSALFALLAWDRVIDSGGIPVIVAGSSLLIVAFWTGYLIRYGLLFPAGIGVLLILSLLLLMRRDRHAAPSA